MCNVHLAKPAILQRFFCIYQIKYVPLQANYSKNHLLNDKKHEKVPRYPFFFDCIVLHGVRAAKS